MKTHDITTPDIIIKVGNVTPTAMAIVFDRGVFSSKFCPKGSDHTVKISVTLQWTFA